LRCWRIKMALERKGLVAAHVPLVFDLLLLINISSQHMRLSRRTISPVPLYFKVMTEIRDNILSGTWSRVFQLPGELDLARRLGVSVITVPQALGQLAQERLVRRERAKGTFVIWHGPVNQLLGTERIEPGAELQRVFKLSGNEKSLE
jgi:DNA-binding transcriptional regulator YhcF (GntR family)